MTSFNTARADLQQRLDRPLVFGNALSVPLIANPGASWFNDTGVESRSGVRTITLNQDGTPLQLQACPSSSASNVALTGTAVVQLSPPSSPAYRAHQTSSGRLFCRYGQRPSIVLISNGFLTELWEKDLSMITIYMNGKS